MHYHEEKLPRVSVLATQTKLRRRLWSSSSVDTASTNLPSLMFLLYSCINYCNFIWDLRQYFVLFLIVIYFYIVFQVLFILHNSLAILQAFPSLHIWSSCHWVGSCWTIERIKSYIYFNRKGNTGCASCFLVTYLLSQIALKLKKNEMTPKFHPLDKILEEVVHQINNHVYVGLCIYFFFLFWLV